LSDSDLKVDFLLWNGLLWLFHGNHGGVIGISISQPFSAST
jgi:hypothetical protein